MTETALNWRKSTYSGNDNDACVEVADNVAGVHVRDTKDHARGEVMAAPAAWAAFTAYEVAQSPWRKSTYSGPENDNCARWPTTSLASGSGTPRITHRAS